MPALKKVTGYWLLVTGKKGKQGFTLLELMIAVSIIAIISAVGITSFSQSQKLGRDSRRKQDLRSIAVALELYYQEYGRYPCSGGAAANSSEADWMTDRIVVGCNNSTSRTLAPAFINTMPKEPLPGATAYSYFSVENSPLGIQCSDNSWYLLTALLENPADSESYGNAKPTVCGIQYPDLNISDNMFAIYAR